MFSAAFSMRLCCIILKFKPILPLTQIGLLNYLKPCVMRDFCLCVNSIYFLNLIIVPIFPRQTLTHTPRNMYQLSKSIFGHIVNDLVYEMWVSKVTRYFFFYSVSTYSRIADKRKNMLLLTKQGITDMHDTFCSVQRLLFRVRHHSFTGFVNEDTCIFYRMCVCLSVISNMLMCQNGNRPSQNL